MWGLVLAMIVGAAALHKYRKYPALIARCRDAKRRMPAKQIYLEDRIRDLERRRIWVGVFLFAQGALTLLLWWTYLGK